MVLRLQVWICSWRVQKVNEIDRKDKSDGNADVGRANRCGRSSPRVALVNKVVPANKLDGEVDELIKKLLSKSPVTLGIVKDVVNSGIEMDLEHALDYEAECFGQALATEDARRGLKGFLKSWK